MPSPASVPCTAATENYRREQYPELFHLSQEIDDKLSLFSYFEYVGENYEEDMKKMAADSVTQRWWAETDPCQIPLPEAAVQGDIWLQMEEVFHTD